jgi:glycosyltransferase involved in cell wall biosynthesis
MNILWICGARIAGGAERTTAQLAALLRRRGHQVAVAAPAASRVCELAEMRELELLSAPLGGAMNPRAPVAIARLLARQRPDIALVTTADEWVWSCLVPRPRRTRLVLVRHMALPLAGRVQWLAARRADAVVAVSEAVRASLAGVPAARVHVIHNPVRFAARAAAPAAAARAAARAQLRLPATGRLVAFFGGHDPAKGLADVARAVRAADGALGEVHLLVCGRRPANAPPDVGLRPDRVHDRGEIEAVETALTAADLVVMATHSRLSEALPATLLEAMACGTPVAAYASGGMCEAIGADGGAGRLAVADDAADLARVVIEVLRDASMAARLAAAGLERVRTHFAAESAVARYEALFAARSL